MKTLVQDAQASLRSQYKETPALAMVVNHSITIGKDLSDPFHSTVDPKEGSGVLLPIGVHTAVGGPYDAPCPGDLLCAALAACQDSSLRMVANRLGVEIVYLQVRVTAQVDVRGALGMEPDVPVGFQSMTCEVNLKVRDGTPENLVETLQIAAQRCCVVRQTLQNPPSVTTKFISG
jgi:uncharacterized OsmC-like protein